MNTNNTIITTPYVVPKGKVDTTQKMFDYVVNHLSTQNKRSVSELSGKCSYRGDNNLMCAAGCLINDGQYHFRLENRGVRDDNVTFAIEASIGRALNKIEVDILRALQIVHDCHSPEEWSEELDRQVRKPFGLN